jgi:hypothetical protein
MEQNITTLIYEIADKRNSIVNLIQQDYIDDANDLIKYQAICDTYEKVTRDLVRIFNKDSQVQINVESVLAYRKLGG